MPLLAETMESLEISFAFVQFLGLYSSYGVEWRLHVQSLFRICSFFNLDVSMMHLACFEQLGFTQLWAVQTFLPLAYFPLSVIHLRRALVGFPPPPSMNPANVAYFPSLG